MCLLSAEISLKLVFYLQIRIKGKNTSKTPRLLVNWIRRTFKYVEHPTKLDCILLTRLCSNTTTLLIPKGKKGYLKPKCRNFSY